MDASRLAGTGGAYVLQNVGRNVLRVGQNEYENNTNGANGDLVDDFDPDGTDSIEADGDVVVNDPAGATNGEVRRVYDRAQLERIWIAASGGTAYVIRN